MIRTAILGASGYVGGELLRLCAAHPGLEPAHLIGDASAGRSLESVHPHLALAYAGMTIEAFDEGALDDVDLVFAALPHGHSQRIAARVLDRAIPFVDLGADFRLSDPESYRRWYGQTHEAPQLIAQFAYGIPEIGRERIRGAKAVAAAGCYPTAAILALKPLIDAGLASPSGIIVNAASGVSGAGRAASEATSFATVGGSMAAYGLLNHRHTAEMEQALGASVLFTPHLAPMARGILATCYAPALAAGDPLELLRDAYAHEPFIHVGEQPPATKSTAGSNAVHLTARRDERTGHVVAIAALDNLGKGAAGQMIQCANLMLGVDEALGLSACGVQP